MYPGPQMIAAMAAFGYDRVSVGRKPHVAVLSTGSEIVAAYREALRDAAWLSPPAKREAPKVSF